MCQNVSGLLQYDNVLLNHDSERRKGGYFSKWIFTAWVCKNCKYNNCDFSLKNFFFIKIKCCSAHRKHDPWYYVESKVKSFENFGHQPVTPTHQVINYSFLRICLSSHCEYKINMFVCKCLMSSYTLRYHTITLFYLFISTKKLNHHVLFFCFN